MFGKDKRIPDDTYKATPLTQSSLQFASSLSGNVGASAAAGASAPLGTSRRGEVGIGPGMSEGLKEAGAAKTSSLFGQGRSVLIITDNKVEDLEFFYPYYRLLEAGFRVDVATPDGKFEGKQGLGLKETLWLEDVRIQNYDLLVIPGGKAPARLKENSLALSLVMDFVATGRPVAAICHGPQLLAAAGVIKGCRIAAWPECEEEVREAGASYQNLPTVIDGQFITGRWPADLPSFMANVLACVKASLAKHRVAA